MNGGTRTAPSGAQVPAAIRAAVAHDDPGALAAEAIDASMRAAKISHYLGEDNTRLRAELRAALSEVEGLKRHIEAMGRSE